MFPTKEKTIVPSLPCGPQLLGLIRKLDTGIEFELKPELATAANLEPVAFARAFVNLRDLKDSMDAAQKKVNALYEEWKTIKLPACFDQNGIPSITLEEGYRVVVSNLVRASMKADKKEEAMEWLRQNNLGDIVTSTVNASTLSGVARSMADDNQELSPDFFNVVVLNTTSVVRTK